MHVNMTETKKKKKKKNTVSHFYRWRRRNNTLQFSFDSRPRRYQVPISFASSNSPGTLPGRSHDFPGAVDALESARREETYLQTSHGNKIEGFITDACRRVGSFYSRIKRSFRGGGEAYTKKEEGPSLAYHFPLFLSCNIYIYHRSEHEIIN